MKVTFKKNSLKQNNLSVLLQELHKIKRLKDDGKDRHEGNFNISFKSEEVSFVDSIKYNIINSFLVKSVKFQSNLSDHSKDQIVKHSLNEIAIKNITSEDQVLKVLNRQYSDYYKGKRVSSYNLLATLSINKLPFTTLKINEATISIYNEFPTQYLESRAYQFERHYSKKEETTWTKIIITVEDRDFQDAFQKAYSCLEVLRAFLNLQITSWRLPLTAMSINLVLIGDFLTLHNENGECFEKDYYWYEPAKRNIKLYIAEKDELSLLEQQTPKLIHKLNSCKSEHKITLTKVLCQYVSAYDLVDKESCFLKGWAVLENLIDSHVNEVIIKRCLTQYIQPDYLRLEIEALKNYRNELVHEVKSNNDNGSEILNYCYILLKFLNHQISFNLNYCGKISSISEYAEYLDYLDSKESINNLDKKYKDLNRLQNTDLD